MNIVPITVPMINMANTPLDSGELKPYLSTTTATFGSLPMEFVIPIDSFLSKFLGSYFYKSEFSTQILELFVQCGSIFKKIRK